MYTENYTTTLDHIIRNKIPVACFDLSNASTLVENLQKTGWNIVALITKSEKTNTDVTPKIINLSDAIQYTKIFDYIVTPGKLEAAFLRIPQFRDIPVVILTKDRNRSAKIYDIYMKNLDNLLEVYNQLEDEPSRKAFLGFITAKVTRNLNRAYFSETSQYICEGFLPKDGALVVDGGACDGSTSAKFADMGYRVIAFELDEANFKLAELLACKKNFSVENLGLGAFKHKAKYTREPNHMYTHKVSEFGTSTVEITTLDSYFHEHRLPKVEFIKLDVEGAELDVLKGATSLITHDKPILAISIYHKIEHLWLIPKFIKNICNNYKFSLRHFVTNIDDAPNLFNESLQKELYSLTGSPGLVSFGECVLFAK